MVSPPRGLYSKGSVSKGEKILLTILKLGHIVFNIRKHILVHTQPGLLNKIKTTTVPCHYCCPNCLFLP